MWLSSGPIRCRTLVYGKPVAVTEGDKTTVQQDSWDAQSVTEADSWAKISQGQNHPALLTLVLVAQKAAPPSGSHRGAVLLPLGMRSWPMAR